MMLGYFFCVLPDEKRQKRGETESSLAALLPNSFGMKLLYQLKYRHIRDRCIHTDALSALVDFSC